MSYNQEMEVPARGHVCISMCGESPSVVAWVQIDPLTSLTKVNMWFVAYARAKPASAYAKMSHEGKESGGVSAAEA